MIIIIVTLYHYSVSAPGDVWECEVRSKWCVLCWPHASTSAPWSQLRSGRESLQIRAKQSKAALAAPARPSQAEREARGLVTAATGQIVDHSRGLWLVNWAVLGLWLADTGQALAAEIERITPSHTSQPASPSVLWWNTLQYLISSSVILYPILIILCIF